MELNNITKHAVINATDRLNNRPRKCLDFKTPYEAFREFSGFDARILVIGYSLMGRIHLI